MSAVGTTEKMRGSRFAGGIQSSLRDSPIRPGRNPNDQSLGYCQKVPTEPVYPRPEPRVPARSAFTLAELMVSVAVLVVAMLAVGYIFSAVTKTTQVATGTIELTDVVDVLQKAMQADLNAMAPGVLIIDSPDPNFVHPEPNYVPDIVGEPFLVNPDYAPRRDRLVFLTSTNPGTYQSWFYPDSKSGEAIIYYGHAGEHNNVTGVVNPVRLPRFPFDRWLLRRVILLGCASVPTPVFPLDLLPPVESTDPNYSDLVIAYRTYFSADDAVQETLGDLLVRLRTPDHSTTAGIRNLYQRSVAGPSLEQVSDLALGLIRLATPADRYVWRTRLRHCFEMMPHVGHFILEWSDGTPGFDSGVQWFGLPQDNNRNGIVGEPNEVHPKSSVDVAHPYVYKWPPTGAGNNYVAEEDPTTTGLDGVGYRAVWRADKGTWQYRPKALRVTVRLYDSNKRIRDDDNRLGREYSFVLQVP